MSLINRVLHDLEDRSALLATTAPGVIGDLRSAQDFAQIERRGRLRLAASAAAVAALLAAGLIVGRTAGAPWALPQVHFGGAMPVKAVPSEGAAPIAASPPGAPAVTRGSGLPAIKPAGTAEPAAGLPDLSALALKLDTRVIGAAQESPAAGSAELTLTGLSHRSTQTESDINIELSSAPDYRLFVLRNPDRLLVQFPRIALAPGVLDGVPADGMIRGIRYAQQDTVSKLIFDLSTPVLIEAANVTQAAPNTYSLHIGLAGLRPAASPAPPASPDGERTASAPAAVRPAAAATPAAVATPAPADNSRTTPADDAFNRGFEAYKLGDTAAAAADLRQALEDDPRNLRARQLLASILVDQKDLDGAKRLLSEGLRLVPADTSLAKTYATVLLDDNQPAEALQVLARHWPPIAADPEYHALAAALFQRQGNHTEAARVYRALLQFDPGRGLWWTGLGISLEALGDRSGALAAYAQAVNDHSMTADVIRYLNQRMDALKQAPG